jgi:hypothetical protein
MAIEVVTAGGLVSAIENTASVRPLAAESGNEIILEWKLDHAISRQHEVDIRVFDAKNSASGICLWSMSSVRQYTSYAVSGIS